MLHRLAALGILLAGIAPSGAALADDEPSDVLRSWESALVAVQIETPDLRRVELGGRINASYIVKILDGMSEEYPQPVVIFFHDCGFAYNDPEARQQIKFIASLGYFVFAPDSFARRNRPRGCDAAERRFLEDVDQVALRAMRLEEIVYALDRVLALPWVDPKKIFIVGAGEAGDALLAFDSGLIAGRIALSPSCMFEIVHTPATPTLIMRSDRDVWYDSDHWAAAGPACENAFGNDPTVEIAVVDGALHDPLIYPAARTRFWNFVVRANFF
jgi:dienelactone hydrolase